MTKELNTSASGMADSPSHWRILICAAAFAFTDPLCAQTVSGSSTDLQEVVVTATKQGAQTVLTVPGAIQAITGDTLQKQGTVGFLDVAGQIPGLSIEDLGPGDRKYIIRGISSTGESTTGVYYDEAVISGSNANDGGGFESDIRLYDMDRIEVLRGPQGTLYGTGSMSGTIKFVTNKPDLNTFGGYVTADYSDTSHGSGNYNFNGAINLPIIDDVLGARIVAWKVNDSGYINQIRIGTIGLVQGVNNDDVDGGRISLRFRPIENLTVDASATAQTETSNGPSLYTPAGVTAWGDAAVPQLKPVQGCDLCNTDVALSPFGDNLHVFSLTASYTTTYGTVTGTTNQFDRKLNFNLDSTPILLSFGIPIEAETYEPQKRDVNSSELRYASTFNSPVNFVVGAFRQYETNDLTVDVVRTNGLGQANGPFSTSNADDALANPDGNTFFGRIDDRTDTQYSGFGEVTWKVTPQLSLLGGLRYYTENLQGVQVQTHPFGGFPAGSSGITPIPDTSQTFSKVTSKYNASYTFNDSILVYATAAQGFRGGGLNAQSEPFEPIPPSFQPDSLWSYEIGAKGKLFNGQFDYQVDTYEIFWSNIQVNETTPTGGFNYTGNAGDARVKGFEFQLDARPVQGLQVSLAGSYTDAYLTRGATATQFLANPTLGLTGEKIPEVPLWQTNLGVDYTVPLFAQLKGTLGGDVSYRDKEDSYFASNSYNVPLASYALVNLRAGLSSGLWTETLFVRNATDKRAQVSAVNNPSTPESIITVRPRTIGISVTRKF